MEVLLYSSVVFAPWAFGSTQPWAIWTLNTAGYCMGLLLAGKWLVCWKTGYIPTRWNGNRPEARGAGTPRRVECWLQIALASAPLFLLLYCLVAALNASATYHHELLGFTYHSFVSWLPHSFDSRGTWFGFWNYLSLLLWFWAVRDWLLGKTRQERHLTLGSNRPVKADSPPDIPAPLPARIRRLLWILCLNGALLGLVSILQRLDGTSKLLWLVEPRTGTSKDHFGPFNYRSNAAQYFNLLWPICIGFWWQLHHWHHQRLRLNPRLGSGAHLLLLPASILMAACPMVSTSRGGALLGLAGLPLVMLVFYLTMSHLRHWKSLLIVFAGLLASGLYLGWAPLQDRLVRLRDFTQDASSVERLDQNARTMQMIRDYPLFGIGPNAYEAIYPLYRTPGQPWYPFAHNDWLQFLAEWGAIGFSVILIGLVSVTFFPWQGTASTTLLQGTFLVSFVLVLVHATIDFPFQVHSVFFSFIILLSLYTCLPEATRR